MQIGTSIFDSNIGSEHLVGLAGAGFATGMAMAHWEMQGWLILILGWVFVPLYDRMKVFTMPEFLELRFGKGPRRVLSVLTMAALVLTKIAATIYAGDVVVRTLFGLGEQVTLFGVEVGVFWLIALGLALTTGIYTVCGGMRVIMYTAVFQAPVLLLGSLAILYFGLDKLGDGSLATGWHRMLESSGDKVHLIRSNADPEWPWLAVLPGAAIIGFWYWCTDQYIVQRVLAGRNQTESRRGSIFAAYLKLTPVFIFLLPGMVAYALTKTPASGFTSPSGDAAYTSLVAQVLPHGVRGLVACGMLVALMASLAAKFNASATLFTMDFYRAWKPEASPRSEVRVGRIATAAIVLLGILWVLVIKSLHSNLYEYLQSVQGYLAPSIVVLFVFGIFWKRATAPAALTAFIVGITAGFARLACDLIMGANAKAVTALKEQLYRGEITAERFAAELLPLKAKLGVFFPLWNIHWLYYSQIILVLVSVVIVAGSLLTAPPAPGTVRFTWFGATPEEKAATRAGWNAWDVVLSAGVVLACILFYLRFW